MRRNMAICTCTCNRSIPVLSMQAPTEHVPVLPGSEYTGKTHPMLRGPTAPTSLGKPRQAEAGPRRGASGSALASRVYELA